MELLRTNIAKPPGGVAVYPHAVGAVAVLWVFETELPVAHARSIPVSEGRRLGVPHTVTLGGSYTSSFVSIWKIDTSSFRAVATIATLCGLFLPFRNRQ
jgi:hypothetical protein